MRVAILQADKSVRIEERPIPTPKPNEVLLKILCVGANPSEHMHIDTVGQAGDWLGTDFVGEVVELGSAVPKDKVNVGELRWNYCRGGIEEKGAFADYITTEWDLSSLVPPNITPQEAATIPLTLMTAVQALYLPSKLNLPSPPEQAPPNTWILIWSGATTVGSFAIQIAKASGLKVATTASSSRWDLLKSYGADVILDYKDPSIVRKLKEATNDSIQYGLDCITLGDSTRLSQLAFRPEGGHLITALQTPRELPRPEVRTEFTFVYTMLGEDQPLYGEVLKTDATQRALQVYWAKLTTQLLEEGKMKPVPFTVLGGLEKVQEGIDILRARKNDGKLVYNVNART